MKKILIIMILVATIFIPISQTGASMRGEDVIYESKAKESQIVTKQVSDNILNSLSMTVPEKVKKEEITNKSTFNIQKSPKKKISSERKERLAGLLLLAYGGQR